MLDVTQPAAFYSTVDTIQVYLKVWLIYILHFAQQKLCLDEKCSQTDMLITQQRGQNTYNKLWDIKSSFLNITSSTWHEMDESKLFKHTSLLCDHGWVGARAGGAAAAASYKPPLVLPLLISS